MRVYVATMAPEVAGRIVELPVKDNQFVHKGDLLMVIDPTDYKMAVSLWRSGWDHEFESPLLQRGVRCWLGRGLCP